MPIFYLDSGSIDNLEISSSLLVSGSLTLSGSMNSQGGLTGSLLGTASWAENAVTASYITGSAFDSANPVLSASYALSSSFAVSASWAPGATSTPTFPFTGSAIISGSLIVTGAVSFNDGFQVQTLTASVVSASSGFTGSLFGTASWAQNAQVFPYTGSAQITGSLGVTGSGYFTDKLFVNAKDADLDPTNPERLFVSGSNINVIHGEANINTYAQLNIVNFSNGAASSADIVATNNTGTENGNYVDLGINGSNFGGAVGTPNEAYLFNTGSNFLIGNITRGANANLKFFAGNDGTVFPLVVTGSTAIVTGSLLGTASQALTASSIGQLNQQVIVTGSVILSSSVSTQNELTVVGQTVITGSLIVSGTLGSGVFSKGGTVADFVNLIAISASYYVWRAPYSASVVALYGRRETGSATTEINARRSGSAGYALHTGSNLVLTADTTWVQANSVQNTEYAPGESLEIIVSGSNNRQVAVQVDFIKL